MFIAFRLLLAVIFGSIIGLEREINNHPAGFRTHILVCIGATLITLISIHSFETGDPGRVAAQIVSGIGFLGAGTIMREGTTIRGLTTAASLWSVAGVGMAIGSGFYIGATLTTVLMVIVLFFFNALEKKILQRQYYVIDLTIADVPGQLGRVASKLGEMGVSIKTLQISPHTTDQVQVEMGIKTPAPLQVHDVVNLLAELEGVFTIKFEES
jgi:putative Mg2+ transporter-C (MgtC) family protein